MRKHLGVLVAGTLLLGVTSCGGPKLDEVGSRFQQDAQRILDGFADTNALEGSKPTVKQDAGSDVACPDGKAKRVFEASVPVRTYTKLQDTLENTIAIVYASSKGYSIKTVQDKANLVRRETTLRADDYPATLKAVVVAAPIPTLTFTGETDCLDAG